MGEILYTRITTKEGQETPKVLDKCSNGYVVGAIRSDNDVAGGVETSVVVVKESLITQPIVLSLLNKMVGKWRG